MRIIILCDFAVPSGGAQKVAVQSARALAEAGVAVTLVHAVAGADARLDHPSIERICLDFADVWTRPALAAAVAGVWNRPALQRLAPIIAERAAAAPGATILHLHQWTRALSPAAFGAAFASGVPLVVTAHDYFLACPNGLYYRFDQQRPCALQPLSRRCMTARCDPRSTLHKAIRTARSLATAATLAGRSFDVVHVSDRGRDVLMRLLPDRLRHHRIDNPIDLPQAPPAVLAPDAAFAYIGRLTRDKGAIVAAEAARRVGAPIRFFGEGPAEADIRAINPAAEMLGWRSGAEVAAALRGSIRAVLAPSQWDETGPLTVYEAAAAGVPAIVSNRCGAAERVSHGTSGLVVEPDAASFAAALDDLADTAVAQRFGLAAHRAHWQNPPTLANHAQQLTALYGAILARR